ncbi:MAG: GDP-L-fucose synthase [Deltaproteobacteria bacterium]|nr:GDP-L-fucose synthase [Deltaproteobacteria bacterium]
MEKDAKIYVAGASGLIGSAVVRQLQANNYKNIITKTHQELDLTQQSQVSEFFNSEKPDYVFLCAGKTGGVYANDNYRAEFIYENIAIQSNVIHNAFLYETRKLIFFSCSCIYPKFCPQPMKEEHLLTGKLEPTNEPFAIAKLAGMKMCESYYRQYGCDFITIIPTNIYGKNQNYTPLNSLIIPALIDRFHEAKVSCSEEVQVWGSGRPLRDFLFSDDLADAAIFLMNNYSDAMPINAGTGSDIPVSTVAETIANVVGYKGKIVYESSKPEGVLVKLQDISKISEMGWSPKMSFHEGISLAYKDYLNNYRLKLES